MTAKRVTVMQSKTNPSDEFRAVLEKTQGVEASLAKVNKLASDSAVEQQTLEAAGDLSDLTTVGRITSLSTISRAAAIQITLRGKEFEAAKIALVDASEAFIRTVLGPRGRDLESRALAKVEGALKQLFPDKDALRAAAYQSGDLQQVAAIRAQLTLGSYDADCAMRRAKELLEAYSAIEAFEQKQLG